MALLFLRGFSLVLLLPNLFLPLGDGPCRGLLVDDLGVLLGKDRCERGVFCPTMFGQRPRGLKFPLRTVVAVPPRFLVDV